MIPTIETERLEMRPFAPDDLAALTGLHHEASFWWFPMRRGMTPDETARFLDRQLSDVARPGGVAFHALVERSTGTLVGWAGLSVPDFLPEVLPAVEVGWRLGSDHRGKGYATEAALAALEWGFDDLGLETIISIYEPDNRASGRVMDRLGFDAGSVTTHLARGLVVVVRSLTVGEWRDGP